MIQLCNYGCGQEAKYLLKHGKWCCSKSFNSCPAKRKKHSKQIKELHQNPNSKYNSISYREKLSNNMKDLWDDPNSIFNSDTYKEKQSNGLKDAWKNPNSGHNLPSRKEKRSMVLKELWADPNSKYNSQSYKEKQINNMKDAWKDPHSKFKLLKINIENINKKYPFFSKIEEMRYNPNTPLEEKEIQVRCKNRECENSKEKGGWFTPTYIQLYERIRQLERSEAGCYLYCSEKCKDTCSLSYIYSDPYKNNNLPYTYTEYQTFRTFVLTRNNYICQFCGNPATHVHHERPQKLEPFYALDPDFAWSCCKKCHYEKGHKDECSTGNLSKIVCSVESQKFLDQK